MKEGRIGASFIAVGISAALGGCGSTSIVAARRVAAAADAGEYVRFEPDPGIRLEKLRAAAGEDACFLFPRIRQDASRPVPGGFHVERGGEIVASAIAAQIEAMGFPLWLPVPAGEERRPMIYEDILFRADGAVAFWVMHGKIGDAYRTSASIVGEVKFIGGREGSERASPAFGMNEEETISSPSLEGSSERARKAAAAVLDRAVKELFRDPKLDAALGSMAEGCEPEGADEKGAEHGP